MVSSVSKIAVVVAAIQAAWAAGAGTSSNVDWISVAIGDAAALAV